MWRGAAILMLTGGCELVFPVHVSGPDLACSEPLLDHRFDEAPAPCTGFGTPFNTGSGTSLDQVEGLLVIGLSQAQTDAGCRSDPVPMFGDGGIAAEVDTTLTATDGFTALQLVTLDRSLSVINGRLKLATLDVQNEFGFQRYVPELMRWWRLRPDRQRGMLVAEYSRDGADWNLLTETAVTLPATTEVVVMAGFVTNAAPEEAAFDRVVSCPGPAMKGPP